MVGFLNRITGDFPYGETLVPERGLEPPLPCENCDLNAARLPIPPFWHLCGPHRPGRDEACNVRRSNESYTIPSILILPGGSFFVNPTRQNLRAPYLRRFNQTPP